MKKPPGSIVFQWLCFSFDDEAKLLRRLLRSFERSVADAGETSEAIVANLTTQTYHDEWFKAIAKLEIRDWSSWPSEYATQLCYAFLALLHARIELRLVETCNRIGQLIGQQPHLPRKNKVGHAVAFLRKKAKLKVPTGRTWNTIQELQVLRNAIVHENGRLPLTTLPGLKRDHDGRAVIDATFCREVLDDVWRFFDELWELNKDAIAYP